MPILLLQQQPPLLIGLVFLIGLLVGSFLNVVIYRLPVMLQRGWRQDCLAFLQLPPEPVGERFNLLLPRSRCGICQTTIKSQHNIPVVSYLWLKGRCAYCGASISCRYPLIEAFSAITSAIVAWQLGWGLALPFALLLTWALIALCMIDFDAQLLPDAITLPVLWLGLGLSVLPVFVDSPSSILGALGGYLSLWSVYQLFKLATGKEGMGFGDFKLLALLGAWLGWQMLPLIIVVSSLVGSVVGIGLLLFKQHDAAKPIPFGPYLAAAGWLALLWGEDLNRLYWGS
jgi:leader peptidase (prepilin peptidase)/N-methyltransferase